MGLCVCVCVLDVENFEYSTRPEFKGPYYHLQQTRRGGWVCVCVCVCVLTWRT